MKKILLFGSLVFLICACNKSVIKPVIQAMPVTSGYPLYSIVQTTDSSIVVAGGNNYFVASLFIKKNNASWQPIIMPNGSAKLQCLATKNNEVYAGGLSGFFISGFTNNLNWNTWNTSTFQSINAITPQGDDLIFSEGLGMHGIYTYNPFKALLMQHQYSRRVTNVQFYDDSIGYASMEGGIMKTTDGGKTWTNTKVKNDIFTDIVVLSKSSFISCGLAGAIYFSNDSGETLETIKSKKHFDPLNKMAYDENRNICLVVGDKGYCYQVNTITKDCKEIESFTQEDIFGVCKGLQHQFLLCGDKGSVWTCDL